MRMSITFIVDSTGPEPTAQELYDRVHAALKAGESRGYALLGNAQEPLDTDYRGQLNGGWRS